VFLWEAQLRYTVRGRWCRRQGRVFDGEDENEEEEECGQPWKRAGMFVPR
jgi:hypothetical protein